MSNAVSALPGAEAGGIAQVREMGLQGMVSLRGDLANAALRGAVQAATGHDIPTQRQVLGGLGGGVAWMSPDELMLFCDHAKAGELAALLTKALSDEHHLAVNVSDARAVFEVAGATARDVLAKVAPVDLAPGQFEPGDIRRTRLAQIPAALWMADAERFHIVCFRSVAQYACDVLSLSAAPGSAVTNW